MVFRTEVIIGYVVLILDQAEFGIHTQVHPRCVGGVIVSLLNEGNETFIKLTPCSNY